MTVYNTTVTATNSTNNTITVASADNMFPGLPITFSAPTIGGLTAGATYYIGRIVVGYPTSTITVSALPGGQPFVLTTATGSMTATFTDAGQRIIETVPPGAPLNDAFTGINLNFDQIFAAGPVGSNVQISNTTVTTITTNANLILAPNGTGNVVSNVSVVPNSTNTHNLGSLSQQWATVYTQALQANSASLTSVSIASANNISVDIANLHIGGGTNGYVLQTDGAGDLSWTAMAGSGDGNPGGANNQVQYNDDGVFAGSSSFEFDPTTGIVTMANVSVTGQILGSQVRIGSGSGNISQGANAVAIGLAAGNSLQGANAVAIGRGAGWGSQGLGAIAIGAGAGHVSQGNNSIVINASGGNLTSYGANAFVVAPIRNDSANTVNALYYNTATKEITYGPPVGGSGSVPIHDGNVVPGQYYISTVPPGEPLNDAFNAINLNFDQLFTAGPVLSNIRIANNIISTIDTNGNLVLSPNGTGNVVSNVSILPNTANTHDLGSAAKPWSTVYSQNLNATRANLANATITSSSNITVAVGNLHITGGTNGYVLQTDGNGELSWTAMSGGSGNGNPGGSNTQIQYNEDGVFAGSNSFVFDSATDTVTANNLTITTRINGDQVRIGSNTGNSGQGANAVAIGRNSGAGTQGANAVAIGQNAGYGAQGVNAVAIGSGAGHVNQANNSVVINASGSNLTSYTANSFVIAPVRNDSGNTVNVLYYNTDTKEVTYGPSTGGGNVPIHDGNVADGQYYISTVPPGEPLNDAFNAINLNFDQIFTAGPVLSNIRIANNEISTLNTNGNLVLNPNGVGRVVANADVIPDQTRIRSLGSPARQWDAIYAQYLEISGNVVFANLLVSGTVSAGGNVYGANLLTTGNVSAEGNVTGNYFLGNGAFLTGVITSVSNISNGTSNVNVVSSGGNVTVGVDGTGNVAVFSNTGLDINGTVSASGNITGSNIFFDGGIVSGTGNIYANKIFANIVGNIDAAGNITEIQFNTTGDQLGANANFTYDYANNLMKVDGGNIQAGNILITTVSANGNVTGGNVLTNGLVSANGNVTGGNLLFGSGIVSGTGNIYADKIYANIVGNVDAAGNITEVQFNTTGDQLGASSAFTFNSTSNVLTVSGNIQSNVVSSPVVITNELRSDDSSFINVHDGLNVLGDVDVFGNVLTTGIVSAGGGVYGNIVGPIPASSRIIYVAKNGNDSNNGTLNNPFLTVKAAMTAATAGTSVHVAPGTYTEINPITIPANVALMGDNLRSVTIIPSTPASDLFYMSSGTYVWGITIKNYLGSGFSYNPATPAQNVFVSPYIQNITSSTTTGTAVYIDGNNVSLISTKAMIVGFFTIINQGGMGIHILNSGYSQLVNIYTIACNIGVKVESGAFCTLNGSDCSIGNYGLVADGVGPLQTSGTTVGYSIQGIFVLNNLSNGQPHVNTVMKINGDPEYYTIDIILPNIPSAGDSTVYVQQTYTANLAPGTNVEFFTRSSIIASAHTFEYVGAGTNPATALPQYGGIPIEANEVIATNGAVITFTSTDQKGNFKVGKGFVINQATGTITGTDFYKSLYAQMTPYILALGP